MNLSIEGLSLKIKNIKSEKESIKFTLDCTDNELNEFIEYVFNGNTGYSIGFDKINKVISFDSENLNISELLTI